MASKKDQSNGKKNVNTKQTAKKRQKGDGEIPSPIKRRTLDKTFPCPTCSKTYTTFENARSHFQKMHAPFIERFLSNPINGEYAALFRRIVSNLDNDFENENCTVCGKTFSMICLVHSHVKEAHSNEANSQTGTTLFSLLDGLLPVDETVINDDQPRSLFEAPSIVSQIGEAIAPQLQDEGAIDAENGGETSDVVQQEGSNDQANLSFLIAQIRATSSGDVMEEQRRRFEIAISRIAHVASKLSLAHEAHRLNVYLITACKFPWLKEHVQAPKPDFSSVISSFAMYENSKPEQSTLIRQRDYRMHITVLTVITAIGSRITRNKVMEKFVEWAEDSINYTDLERYEQEEYVPVFNLVPKTEPMETIEIDE
ncbi:hypothetical protein PRIPAC_97405 [Pristionchus pacificus]|uniref:C2H2-type domain-containing protein n=1 Tax=Pristionchus pacificus TaxID=54126 RepID=A0A2A6CTU4_PRIPA|nr:hypothetical protein PRIPAC_97405 [Pristionchus pacificus]|eukprot:PDM81569.1 hypothetical protein PRIPAC_30550 [Pristionchus pacificus]